MLWKKTSIFEKTRPLVSLGFIKPTVEEISGYSSFVFSGDDLQDAEIEVSELDTSTTSLSKTSDFEFIKLDVYNVSSVKSQIKKIQLSRLQLRQFAVAMLKRLNTSNIENGIFTSSLKLQRDDGDHVTIHFTNTNKFVNRIIRASKWIIGTFDETLVKIDSKTINLGRSSAVGDLVETFSLMNAIELIANKFIKKNQHVIILGLQSIRGNNGIDLSYIPLDYFDEKHLAFANLIEAEIKATSSTTKSSNSYYNMHAGKVYKNGGLPTNIGAHPIRTFDSSNKELLNLVKKNPLLAYTLEGAKVKKCLLELVYAVSFAWANPEVGRRTWLNDETYEGVIPYKIFRDNKWIAVIDENSSSEIHHVIKYKIPGTQKVINEFSQFMKITINGVSDIVVYPRIWKKNKWKRDKWTRIVSSSGSPFYDIAIYYSKEINSFYAENIDQIILGDGNWITSQNSGIKVKNVRNEGFSVLIPIWNGLTENVREGPFSERHYSLVIDGLFDLETRSIYHGIVARIIKGLCDNLRLFADPIAKDVLSAKRIAVKTTDIKITEAKSEKNIFTLYDKSLNAIHSNAIVNAGYLQLGSSKQSNKVIPRYALYVPISDVDIKFSEIVDILIKDILNSFDSFIDQSIAEIKRMNPDHLPYMARNAKVKNRRLEFLHNLLNTDKITEQTNIYRRLFNTAKDPLNNPKYLKSRSDRLSFYYHWNSEGRGINECDFRATNIDSPKIIEELKVFRRNINTRKNMIQYGVDYITGLHQVHVLPKMGDTIVDIRDGDEVVDIETLRNTLPSQELSKIDKQTSLQHLRYEDLLLMINSSSIYGQISQDKKIAFITISREEIIKLMNECIKGSSLYEKMFDLRSDEVYELSNGKILLGKHFIRTTAAGRQYLRFRDIINEYLIQNIDLTDDLTCRSFLEKTRWSEEWLIFFLNSANSKEMSPNLAKWGYQGPEDYNDLIQMIHQMSYGEYMEFIYVSHVHNLENHLSDPNSPIGNMLWFSLLGKMQNHLIAIRAGTLPGNPKNAGKIEALATNPLVYRHCDNGLYAGIPDISKRYAGMKIRHNGVKEANSVFQVSNSSKSFGNMFNTNSDVGTELLTGLIRKFRHNELKKYDDI
ncbi:MAG: hypothetical protein KAS32_18385, partial [Candidatus Peribacteraceae bacterium]|nr:hypothetical protein [Candidatus Peribacteraceae bacterium]